MLAAAYPPTEGPQLHDFPMLATPKVDGVRALIVDGKLVSRSFKPIPNDKIRKTLEDLLPEGADGELSCGDLYDTTSVVMTRHADVKVFTFYWFDWAYDLDAPYEARVKAMATFKIDKQTINKAMATFKIDKQTINNNNTQTNNSTIPLVSGVVDCSVVCVSCVRIYPLMPKTINNIKDLQYYESYVLNEGFEGLVVRKPNGRYKCGRSTLKEGLMIKIKRQEDYEAIVVGTEELMLNTNDSYADNFGHAKKSSAKKGLCKSGKLGAIAAATDDGDVFRIGTGFTDAQRKDLWISRQLLLGMIVKYRCTGRGIKNLPRCPVFAGFRHADDT